MYANIIHPIEYLDFWIQMTNEECIGYTMMIFSEIKVFPS